MSPLMAMDLIMIVIAVNATNAPPACPDAGTGLRPWPAATGTRATPASSSPSFPVHDFIAHDENTETVDLVMTLAILGLSFKHPMNVMGARLPFWTWSPVWI